MMLIRKYDKPALWNGTQKELYKGALFFADGFFSELKTTNNTLSVWVVENADDRKEIDSVVGALALGRESVQKISFMILSKEKMDKLGIPVTTELGDAPGLEEDDELRKRHRNLSELDYYRMGYVIELMTNIAHGEEDGMKCESRTRKEVFGILRDLIEVQKRVDMNKMNEKLKTDYLKAKENFEKEEQFKKNKEARKAQKSK